MSIITCDECGDVFDSDADPDCFIINDYVVCESCREVIDVGQTEESINSEMRQEFKQANGRYLK